MTNDEPFQDYYDVLQVNPNCDAKILESAYHYLAKIHHPDHSGSPDTTRFHEVIEAYRILRDPERRAQYDRLYNQQNRGAAPKFPLPGEAELDDSSATSDADDHHRILLYLYKKRRENAQQAGVIGFYIQDMLGCSDDHFEFHKWYLKEKGYIQTTEQGELAITIAGVDHVISSSQTAKAVKLMIGRPDETTTESASDPASDPGVPPNGAAG